MDGSDRSRLELIATRFAFVAHAYALWIDRFSVTSEDDLRELHKLIARLQALGAELLSLDLRGNVDNREIDYRDVPNRSRNEGLERRLSLLPISTYSKVFHPLSLSEEPVIGTLQDDLVDIYDDLQDGLALFESGNPLEALWSWQQSYRTHWGRHAAFAQTAIWDFQP